jgi:hypothetical protein
MPSKILKKRLDPNMTRIDPSHSISIHRAAGPSMCRTMLFAAVVAASLTACSSLPPAPADPASVSELIRAHEAATDDRIPPASARIIEDRILALDPDHITGSDVRDTLAHGPTPRVILVHGGVFPVYLLMESFGNFLIGMGYPADKIRDPHDGAFSQSPYGNSERLAGEVAWYYEHDGVRPMMIGHSQGGMQTVKVLHELAGDFDQRIAVWNPVLDRPETRDSIVDPLSHRERPVVGTALSYASVVGAGGVEFLAPAEWSMAGRLRSIPDSVDEFTGFSIAGDIVAWTSPSGAGENDSYRNAGNATVRNVNLPMSYSHVFVPATRHLAEDPRMREWINEYSLTDPPPPSAVPQGEQSANVLWAANVWASIKKHWCIEAQRLIRSRRGLDQPPSRSAQR